MAYVRLDDQIAHHPKVLKAGAEAAWLWACAIAYCNRQLTDGVIPEEALATMGTFRTPVKKLAATLVAVGLFDRVEGGGYAVHDYLALNPDRATVQQRMRDAAGRKAANRAEQAEKPKTAARVPLMSHCDIDETDTSVGRACPSGTSASSRARVPTPPPPPTPPPSPVPSLRSDTHARATGTASVIHADWGAHPARRRKGHCAWESAIGLDVPAVLHEEFLAKLSSGGDHDAEATLHDRYRGTERAYQGQTIGDDSFAFWRARFREWRGTTLKTASASDQARIFEAAMAQLGVRA